MAKMKKLTLAGIAIMVVLLSPGFAQANYGNNSLSEMYPPGPLASAAAETEVIDEIVVVGRKRSVGIGRIFSIEPVLRKLRRFDVEFFPAYVPKPVGQHFEASQLRGPTAPPGLIEVFRVRFGRKGS